MSRELPESLPQSKHPRPTQFLEDPGYSGVLIVRSNTFRGIKGKVANIINVQKFVPLLVEPWNIEGQKIALTGSAHLPPVPITVLDADEAIALSEALVKAGELIDAKEFGQVIHVTPTLSVSVDEAANETMTHMVAGYAFVHDTYWGPVGSQLEQLTETGPLTKRALNVTRGDCDVVAAGLRRVAKNVKDGPGDPRG